MKASHGIRGDWNKKRWKSASACFRKLVDCRKATRISVPALRPCGCQWNTRTYFRFAISVVGTILRVTSMIDLLRSLRWVNSIEGSSGLWRLLRPWATESVLLSIPALLLSSWLLLFYMSGMFRWWAKRFSWGMSMLKNWVKLVNLLGLTLN